MQSFFVQKKTLIIETAILIAVLGGVYYLYSTFTTSSPTVTDVSSSEQLLGQNFVTFIKAVNEDKLSFSGTTFLQSKLVSELRDHSETIGVNDTRGRADPFSPYALTRPLR